MRGNWSGDGRCREHGAMPRLGMYVSQCEQFVHVQSSVACVMCIPTSLSFHFIVKCY